MNTLTERHELEKPVVAVDVVILFVDGACLKVLLHRRKDEPFKDAPALPGVGVRTVEPLLKAAERAISEKIEVLSPQAVYLEQLAAFDAIYRDPRGRTISIAYMGITRSAPKGSSANPVLPVADALAGGLPFDHGEILETAVNRLRGKLRYTNIAGNFLPERFRIDALQTIYEAILGIDINRSNFRNKLLKIGMIEQVTVQSDAVGKKGGRPPHLYRFTEKGLAATKRDFL